MVVLITIYVCWEIKLTFQMDGCSEFIVNIICSLAFSFALEAMFLFYVRSYSKLALSCVELMSSSRSTHVFWILIVIFKCIICRCYSNFNIWYYNLDLFLCGYAVCHVSLDECTTLTVYIRISPSIEGDVWIWLGCHLQAPFCS